MVEQSGTERIDVRFGTYIEELREFFTSRGVHFGSPEDVVAFAERIASPSPFEEEMQSLIRSIQFREFDNLGRAEMLELVSVAVGGPKVEGAAQEMHTSVRQIFVFVNEALRQRRWEFSEETETGGETQVTVGAILAAAAPRGSAEERAVGGRSAGNGLYDDAKTGRSIVPGREANSGSSEGSGILFKAVSMAEEESSFPTYGGSQTSLLRRPWFIPAAVAVVLAGGALAFLGKGTGNSPTPAAAPGSTGAVQTLLRPLAASSCVAPSTVGSARGRVEDRSRWAHSLLDQKMFEAALPELQEVARMDPSYPGINLDESNALLQLKRPEDARDAVDSQIGISDCLNRLPGAALDAYCSAEFTPSTVGGCRGQLSHIRQAAELQAALVHLELGHRAAPDTGSAEPAGTDAARATPESTPLVPATAAAEPAHVPRSHRVLPLPAATDEDNGEVAPTRAAAARSAAPATRSATPAARADHKTNGDDALRRGEGTDSAYGAYSRPQE